MGIKHVIVGVEGKVSEAAMIQKMLFSLRQQAPHGYAHLEVVSLSLGGNHGYSDTLFDKYDEEVQKYLKDPKHCFEEGDDEVIRVLVCDYDEMERYGVKEEEFRKRVKDSGITIVMSKPKFELFVALIICGPEALEERLKKRMDLTTIINEGIKEYNNKCEFEFQKISPYSKKQHQAENWFWELFDRNPVFLQRALGANFGNVGDEFYTEVPELMRLIGGFFK